MAKPEDGGMALLANMSPLVPSTTYYLMVFALCEISRQLVDRLTSPKSTIRMFLFDLIGTLQVCTAIYENAVVMKYYGVFGFFVCVTCLIVVHSTINRGAMTNPCAVFERYMEGTFGLWTLIVHMSGEIAGAYLAFRFAQKLWWVGLSTEHLSNYVHFPCIIKVKAPMFVRGAYEFLYVFMTRRALGRTPLRFKKYVTAILTAAGLSFELSYLGPPGLNPINASSRFLGCHGMAVREHFLVHWIFPILGWLTACNTQTPSVKTASTSTPSSSANGATKDKKHKTKSNANKKKQN